MMLSALRDEVLADVKAAAGAYEELLSTADEHLLALCTSLTEMDAALFAQVERGSLMTSSEHDELMRAMTETDAGRVDVAYRISDIPALSANGLKGKLAVIERLLSRRHDDPTPARDALLLSFITDIERICDAALIGRNCSVSGLVDEDGALVAASQACLALLAQVAEGYARLEDLTLPPEQLDVLSAALFPTWQKAHEAITSLCRMRALSLHTAQAKASVLKQALKMDDGDTYDLRVDLARSYISDVAWLLAEADRDCALAGPTGHWWNSLTSRILRRRVPRQ